jgi:peptide/nickel transport system substrate-binding protein
VVRWREIFIFANSMGLNTLIPLPRHLLGALYDAGNKQAFANSLFWTSEWIGLGPYRVSDWMDGSFVEATAFDQYFLGRPKIDRITIRYIFDVNALVLNLIAGDIDVAPVGPFKEEEGYSLKTQWESKGAGTVMLNRTDLRTGRLSWRYPDAPWVQDMRVRHALLHMLDRQTMVETLRHGLSEVADIALSKDDPAYQLAYQRGLPSYPYDVPRAARLLSEFGLTRAADGVYRTASGEPFAIEVGATNDTQTGIQEALSIVDQWKAAGLAAAPLLIGDTDPNKQEIRSKVRGIYMGPGSLGYGTYQNFVAREITSEATRWTGNNRGAYNNSSYDQLMDRVYGTIRASERDQVAAELAKFSLEQLPFLPLYYVNDVAAVRKGVTGITAITSSQPVNAWNIHLWDLV